MKKFSQINESNSEKIDSEQLKIGANIEKEHSNIYYYLDSYLESFNVRMPLSEQEFYEMIAKAHLKEIPDYYNRIIKMESNYKSE